MASQLSHETGHANYEPRYDSVTHQTYPDYYGDWWDANYGGGEKAAQHEDPRDEAFLGSIERLANLAAAGATELLGGWPSAMSLEPASVPHGPWSRYGGGGSITDDRWMGSGEIRTGNDDPERVGIAYFALQGRCLRLASIRSRYPDLVLTSIPRSPLPDEKTAWSTFGPWGKLSFVFTNADRDCVGQISMHPHSAPPPDAEGRAI